MESTYFVSFSAPNILQTNENNSNEYDEGLEELKDVEANACATAKTLMESMENNTYLCINTKLSTVVGHWNKPRMACHHEGEKDEIMHMFATSGAYIRMLPWPPPFATMRRQDCDASLKITLS
jgi:hypothetical protein